MCREEEDNFTDFLAPLHRLLRSSSQTSASRQVGAQGPGEVLLPGRREEGHGAGRPHRHGSPARGSGTQLQQGQNVQRGQHDVQTIRT